MFVTNVVGRLNVFITYTEWLESTRSEHSMLVASTVEIVISKALWRPWTWTHTRLVVLLVCLLSREQRNDSTQNEMVQSDPLSSGWKHSGFRCEQKFHLSIVSGSLRWIIYVSIQVLKIKQMYPSFYFASVSFRSSIFPNLKIKSVWLTTLYEQAPQ